MKYQNIKRAGFAVSQLSLGCMSLHSDQDNPENIIAKAIDKGITLFDTADLYNKGDNEKLLGKALNGKRNDVFISTKVGNRWKSDGSGWDWCPTKNHILSAIDQSLKRLQTDHIDLYLLHGGTMDDPFDEVLEAFELLKQIGKIRAYGVSSIRPNVIKEYVKISEISAVMTQYSLLDRRPEEETLAILKQNDIAVLARGTVAGGLLIDKPSAAYLDYSEDDVKSILSEIDRFRGLKTRQEIVSAYVQMEPAVATSVAGIRTMKQLDEALAAFDKNAMTHAERDELGKMWAANLYQAHR